MVPGSSLPSVAKIDRSTQGEPIGLQRNGHAAALFRNDLDLLLIGNIEIARLHRIVRQAGQPELLTPAVNRQLNLDLAEMGNLLVGVEGQRKGQHARTLGGLKIAETQPQAVGGVGKGHDARLKIQRAGGFHFACPPGAM